MNIQNRFDHLKKTSGCPFFNTAVPVQGIEKKPYYLSLNQIRLALFGEQNISCKSKMLIHKRILEIIQPDTRVAASSERIKELFHRVHTLPKQASGADKIINTLEFLKQEMATGPKFYINEYLSELHHVLKPGDILVKKRHEDQSNVITKAQYLFRTRGYREAYKCSHLALYLGEMQSQPWIAEATLAEGNDIHVRRIKLDDSRFELNDKNQYLIFRNKDSNLAQESARLAKNYAVKMLPRDEKKPTAEDQRKTFRFNVVEATRSLWHSSKLTVKGLFRHAKCYADYHNKIPFEYLGRRRKFYCSHFVITMQTLAEMKKSETLQAFFQKHAPPKKYNENLKGIALKIAKLWYSIKKEFWALWLAIRYQKELKNAFKNQLDPLRTAPHKVVNYMLDQKDQFEFVGTISRRGALAFEN